MFGCYCFFVDGKLCMGVKGEELLVRLPPDRHGEFQEMQNTCELSPGGGMQGYFWVEPTATPPARSGAFWLDEALAYKPAGQGIAAPQTRQPNSGEYGARQRQKISHHAEGPSGKAGNAGKRHSIFDEDD